MIREEAVEAAEMWATQANAAAMAWIDDVAADDQMAAARHEAERDQAIQMVTMWLALVMELPRLVQHCSTERPHPPHAFSVLHNGKIRQARCVG